MKKCKTCKQYKVLEEFYKESGRSTDGYKNHCKECQKEQKRKFYQRNRKKMIERSIEFAKNHLEWRRAKDLRYYARHREWRLENVKQRYIRSLI